MPQLWAKLLCSATRLDQVLSSSRRLRPDHKFSKARGSANAALSLFCLFPQRIGYPVQPHTMLRSRGHTTPHGRVSPPNKILSEEFGCIRGLPPVALLRMFSRSSLSLRGKAIWNSACVAASGYFCPWALTRPVRIPVIERQQIPRPLTGRIFIKG